MTDSLEATAATAAIPVLDLGPLLAGEPGALETLAAHLRHAQEEVGFYYVVNHGIAPGLVRAAYRELERFFALPAEKKLQLRGTALTTGYIPPKSTVYVTSPVNRNTQGDLNEVLRLVRPRQDDHPSILAGRPFTGPNRWPDAGLLPDFKPTLLAYYAAAECLGYRLLPVYARALGLPADWFTPLFSDPTWTTRNAHYPPVAAEPNQFGISPHRDHGFLTLLPLSEEPGLQIRARDGEWIDARPIEGAIIVNTGEFLHRWTNGRFLATPHRVVPPKRDRYSIAFFFNPTWDVISDPLPTCVGPDNPAKFEPVRFLDYLRWYVERNYLPEAGGSPRAALTAAR